MMKRHTLLTAFGMVMTLIFSASTTSAQDSPSRECDDRFNECGTPEESGGGGGGGGGAILIANSDLGDTYQSADDYDNDGHEDPYDLCVRVHDPGQEDRDGDGVGDACDNCLEQSNRTQLDFDGDNRGNACDDDIDGDLVSNVDDNCPHVPNAAAAGADGQADLDEDGRGDACDPDIDGDGQDNLEDECPMHRSAVGGEAHRDDCFPDTDGDGVGDFGPGVPDVCRATYDPAQLDQDGDGVGDACDHDMDGDSVVNGLDNCPLYENVDQADQDRDTLGDACDPTYCYVVFGDEENCLNPASALTAYVPTLFLGVGDEARMPFFVNRSAQALRYHWRVERAPRGSSATVIHSDGEAEADINHEYLYLTGDVATFEPDLPGTYRIRVTIETVGADNITGEVGARAEYLTTIDVADSPANQGGCTIGGPTPSSWLTLSIAGFALFWRKRR